MPQDDIIIIENVKEAVSHFKDIIVDIPILYDHVYTPGVTFTIGNNEFSVIKTPGHTEGGVCLKCRNILFSGDTLFRNAFGRTDLYGGSIQKLYHSVVNVLFYLPDDTVVYPGHHEPTTIEYEKAHNDINRYRK